MFACSSRGERRTLRLAQQILTDMVLDGFVRALDGFEAVLAGVARKPGQMLWVQQLRTTERHPSYSSRTHGRIEV